MDRRTFLVAGGFMLAASPAWAATKKIGVSTPPAADKLHDMIARIEATSGGRLGVALHDTGTGRRFAYRGDERFPLCSTFKLLLTGATLARVQGGKEQFDRRVKIGRGDVVGHDSYDTFTAKHVGGTATVEALCQAMMVESDNGAANLMLAAMGGPEALTRFLRETGDPTTRIDRVEPTASEAKPSDPRDTTTPVAMLGSAERLWLSSALTPAYRAQLVGWAIACTTGKTRLRAGLPAGWRAGDRTGTGEHGTYNDVAIFWPPNRKPVVVTSYLTGSNLKTEAGHAVHRQVARVLAAMI